MNDVIKVLELALRPAREGAAPLPAAMLDGLVRGAGASAGAVGWGEEVLARQGETQSDTRRIELPGGRDAFWLELSGGAGPAEAVRVAAGVVLGSWLTREELKKSRFSERRRLWEVESLRAIAEALGGTLEPERIAEELLLHATALLDARRGEVWLALGGTTRPAARFAGAGGVAACDTSECVMAVRVGGAVLTPEEVATLPDGGLLEPGRMAVPVIGRRGRLGVLALAEREVRGGTAPFGPNDAETLSLYASQAAVALENASLHRERIEQELLERELDLAATIQRQLLPGRVPTPPGFDIAAKCESSRRVGGDVYDLIPTPNGLFLMLGDVAGKGVPAALMAASLQSAVRLLVQGRPPLEDLTRQLHQHVLGSTPESKFATVFLAYLHEGGELEWVSAGHNPVVLARPGGKFDFLRAVGPPLGLLPNATYPAQRSMLAPGDVLLAYTDGLSEAPSEDETGADFGLERITALVERHRTGPMASLVTELFAAVAAHTSGAPPHDDRTVLAICRTAA
ncbi:MAG: PP2C family protein-serine/threonine phosphatase [Thermoanaerobaculales bacterium]